DERKRRRSAATSSPAKVAKRIAPVRPNVIKMNENKPLNEDILLDRLVDGELSGNERRQLLESFDKRPEGWRRCALAFLEAQSWREEMGQVARGIASQTNEPKSPASSAAVG